MAYHPLANDSGSDADNRRSEADRILKILKPIDLQSMTVSEEKFMDGMYGNDRQPISVKQLFWLRDIKDKYL